MTEKRFRTGIFISYSRRDRNCLERLEVHLKPYVLDEPLALWDDTKIAPGADWQKEIKEAIDRARVAILLVSADFLASEYIVKSELPLIFDRAAKDLTLLWIPLTHSAFETTPLKDIQAAHDPGKPLAMLSEAEQEKAFVKIAKYVVAAGDINSVANALNIIDDFEPQIAAFVKNEKEPEGPVVHSVRAEQSHDKIKLVDPGGEADLITAEDLENMDPDSKKLIRSYERVMKELFERWTELKTKRYSEDPEIRREAREKSEELKRDLCAELQKLLRFIESLGKSLMDHYQAVRFICDNE